jgi:hypothetical protein
MKKHQTLGLDELMIVNPGLPGQAELSGTVFLGEDGALYQVLGLEDDGDTAGLSEFYLGDDGRLYQLQGLSALLAKSDETRPPRAFLGADGTQYEIRS